MNIRKVVIPVAGWGTRSLPASKNIPKEMLPVMGEEITPGVYNITDMVEKPAIGTVDSRLAIVGRYVLTPDIFEHLARVKPGHGGEIQLTDALASLARERGMLAVKMGGIRFDAGDWVDYLTANIYFGLRDEKLRDGLKARLRELLD